MTNETDTAANETDPFLLVDAHIAAITPAHQAAFRADVVHDYHTGDVVWMWDHYNTAVISGPGSRADSWAITTTDADGVESAYEYPSAQIRPASRVVEFRWAGGYVNPRGACPCCTRTDTDCSALGCVGYAVQGGE